MIVSASRRTDIPAFYADWFLDKVRRGSCRVANPFRPSQVTAVSLAPDDVEAIVFWSKNPRPLLGHLAELDRRGFRYYFQFTLNDYPEPFEPHLPPVAERIGTFVDLAGRIGAGRVVWRYDPIILSDASTPGLHRERFARIAAALAGSTRRVMVSLVDAYRKTVRNMAGIERAGCRIDWAAHEGDGADALLTDLARIATDHGLEILSCAEPRDLGGLGIRAGRCVDPELIERELGVAVVREKDRGQRSSCGCVPSRDIGACDTCGHGCRYCYSTRDPAASLARLGRHRSDDERL